MRVAAAGEPRQWCRATLVRLDQCEIAVPATVENADRFGVGVPEHDERVLAAIEPERRVVYRHRLDGVAGADDARGPGLRRFGARLPGGSGTLALAVVPLALE